MKSSSSYTITYWNSSDRLLYVSVVVAKTIVLTIAEVCKWGLNSDFDIFVELTSDK